MYIQCYRNFIMKKAILLTISLLSVSAVMGQSPMEAYQASESNLAGTARYMSMAGAFGALGADLSAISSNPGGIGVYRSSDFGFTLGLDFQNVSSNYEGYKTNMSNTRFNINNIGIVGTMRFNGALQNLNVGFTYNRAGNFNRSYSGRVPKLKTSLSNYIAGIANNYDLTENDVKTSDRRDPYNPGFGEPYVPWSAILGYDSYLIDPVIGPNGTTEWYGQFGEGTSGNGYYNVRERGGIDEYNILIGGNFSNKVYWGMNFSIKDLYYSINSIWGENLENAYVFDPNVGRTYQQRANWSMDNLYSVNGTGFSYQLGVIVKPIQELRLGFAFHTPTYYNLTENYAPEYVDYNYPDFKMVDNPDDQIDGTGYAVTNNEEGSSNYIHFRSPWKLVASIAGVIGSNAIISMDYEWNGYKKMSYEENYNDFTDSNWSGQPTAIEATNNMIRDIYKNTSTIRIGAEYRIIPSVSIRAGYSYSVSPVTNRARNNTANIPTYGTLSSFRLNNDTQYVTCGIGYRFSGFYVDAAYIWKHMTADYYPFSPDPYNVAATAMIPKLTFNNSQVILSLGYKF